MVAPLGCTSRCVSCHSENSLSMIQYGTPPALELPNAEMTRCTKPRWKSILDGRLASLGSLSVISEPSDERTPLPRSGFQGSQSVWGPYFLME
eukprot:349668-Chlamydomonas_euryale.AAC.3